MEPRLYGNIIRRAPLWRFCDFGAGTQIPGFTYFLTKFEHLYSGKYIHRIMKRISPASI